MLFRQDEELRLDTEWGLNKNLQSWEKELPLLIWPRLWTAFPHSLFQVLFLISYLPLEKGWKEHFPVAGLVLNNNRGRSRYRQLVPQQWSPGVCHPLGFSHHCAWELHSALDQPVWPCRSEVVWLTGTMCCHLVVRPEVWRRRTTVLSCGVRRDSS